MKHGNRSKKQALKSASTDLGTSDVVLGRILEVTDLPEGITRTEADKLFTQLAMSGAKIQWLKETQGRPGGGGDNNHGTAENGRHSDLAALYTIVAVFPSPLAAQNASLHLNNSLNCFKLRMAKKNYDLRVLERASSQ
ncbi:PREDICTED: R3H domain-containing protein 2-like [Thamnophis sirtalis]|uniref:R3H domain-containing protein 2-like n=2 Tax=Thamnophis TaxID=34999 RepID=A0A6I9Z2Z3_9SAUR|nr:PREDICTED: R3H domain-containing protein 2-like [Thamnophis sirtalis]